jgi:2,4-dienoyl-CoA reductase (NADPH2)
VTDPAQARGGLAPRARSPAPRPAGDAAAAQAGKPGAGLGKTTGWIHRAALKMKRCEMVGGVNYERIGDEGLLITPRRKAREPHLDRLRHMVLCAGPTAAARCRRWAASPM